MKVRLIRIDGECIAETDVEQSTDAIIFAGKVYLKAFTVASFEYFREVSTQIVRCIHTLRADLPNERLENE